MLTFLRTDSSHPDFIALVQQLDAYLAIIDGEEHDFYHQFNHINMLKHVVLAYQDGRVAGCGAFKPWENSAAEIKRMFVADELRGKGIASLILLELERWALESGYEKCILETGSKQVEAVALYTKNGYRRMPNFGQYAGIENSICFEKSIK